MLSILKHPLFVALFCSSPQIDSFNEMAVEQKIDEIIAAMTLKEKVGQTCQITLDAVLKHDKGNTAQGDLVFDEGALQEALVDYKIGSVLNVGSHTLSLDEWTHVHKNINASFLNGETQIPIIYGIDAIHGVNYTVGGTLFPQEIGLAATWNRELAKEFGDVVAYETRASGIRWNFSPVLDLGRQPLWSRHFETLGEDPLLVAEMGREIIKGYQGGDKIDNYHMAACLKHFVGYSAPKSGRDRTPAWIPDKFMEELYLPSFKAAIEEGALTVMINSGDVNGVPGHMNHYLLTEKLKNEWGFKGFTVSDWEDFIMLHTVHNAAADLSDAIVKAFNAGVDMSMVPLSPQYKQYCELMLEAVEDGRISEQRLNDAVRRILRVKILVGLFDKETYDKDYYEDFGSEVYKNKALRTALESITLLKNEDEILPLTKDKKILISGPTSDNLMYLNGAWTHTWQGDDPQYNTKQCRSIKDVFMDEIGAENCLFSKGAELYLEDGFEHSRLVDKDDFSAKAGLSDVIVLCLGEYPATEKPGDIRSLNLDKAQLELAKAAYETGKPVIVVLVEGRPRILREIVDDAKSIVQCYLPGDFGADALLQLVYGQENFSGRLPYTYPKYDGVIEFYDHPRSVDRSKKSEFDAYDPQWNFGYGLGYSQINYSDLKLSSNSLSRDGSISVEVVVSNLGEMKAKEVVQLYVTDKVASLVPRGKSLKGFHKITLAPGETKKIHFKITPKDLLFVDANGNWINENGIFEVSISDLIKEFELK